MGLLSDVLETIKERIRNPITGAFALFWFSWNWKTVILWFDLLFGELGSKDTIAAIVDLYPPEWAWLKLFVGPLFFALLFVVVFPIVSMWPLKKNAEARAKLSDMQHDVRGTMVVPGEKHERMKRQYEKEVRDNEQAIGDLQDRVKSLNQQVADTEQQRDELATNLETSVREEVEKRTGLEGNLEELQAAHEATKTILATVSQELRVKDQDGTKKDVEIDQLTEKLEKALKDQGSVENSARMFTLMVLEVQDAWEFQREGSREIVKTMRIITFKSDGSIGEGRTPKWDRYIVKDDGTLIIVDKKDIVSIEFTYDFENKRFYDLKHYMDFLLPVSLPV